MDIQNHGDLARETPVSAKSRSYSKTAVQKAGKDLLTENLYQKQPARYKECMDILSNWRTCHIPTLNKVTKELMYISISEDENSIVVSRLKRTPSILTKLQRYPKMNLDRMQDIAGCRSIVTSSKQANKIRRQLKRKYALKETNYITKPKDDGYRGLHLIGSTIALPMNSEATLPRLISKLDIYEKFDAFRISLDHIEKEAATNENEFCLIQINTKELSGEIRFFKKEFFRLATEAYLDAEKKYFKNPHIVIALVNVASVDNLKEAFPNYFADSTFFIETLRKTNPYRPNVFIRGFAKMLNKTGLGDQ